jgi:hypothetical protein
MHYININTKMQGEPILYVATFFFLLSFLILPLLFVYKNSLLQDCVRLKTRNKIFIYTPYSCDKQRDIKFIR